MVAFKRIMERVWLRLHDWKLKFLSQDGKEILKFNSAEGDYPGNTNLLHECFHASKSTVLGEQFVDDEIFLGPPRKGENDSLDEL